MSAPGEITPADLENRFTYHAPLSEQIPVFEDIRSFGKVFAKMIVDYCPPSREASLAITQIEDAVHWANAAIARHGLR